jgi:hypothetical protein
MIAERTAPRVHEGARLVSPRPVARRTVLVTSALLAIALSACNDNITESGGTAETLLADALSSTPVGFSSTENSFAGMESETWRPKARRHAGRGGPFGSAFGVGFMGGGLAPDFANGAGFHAGVARGPFGGGFSGDACDFNASTGKVTCAPSTGRLGLTVERWVIWTDINGAPQRRPDSTTATMQTHAEVYGTVPMRDSATRTVRHVSDRLVSGLQQGSTQRTVEGTSTGTETVNGFVREGSFVAQRNVADTTRGLIIPVRGDGRTYPIAGQVSRTMEVTVSIAGGAAETAFWKEVLTYDGSNTATLVITRNGETKTCSVPLPMGRPVCP